MTDHVLPEEEVPPAVAAALGELRAVVSRPPADPVVAAHVEAMLAARPTAPAVVRLERRRRRAVAGIGVAAAVALLSGLSVAGALPGPLQDQVADVVDHLGIDLPGGTDAPDAPEPGAEPSEAPTAPGQSGETPGQSGETPGQSGETPGQSDALPPGLSGATPGQSGQTPAATAPSTVPTPPSTVPSPPTTVPTPPTTVPTPPTTPSPPTPGGGPRAG